MIKKEMDLYSRREKLSVCVAEGKRFTQVLRKQVGISRQFSNARSRNMCFFSSQLKIRLQINLMLGGTEPLNTENSRAEKR